MEDKQSTDEILLRLSSRLSAFEQEEQRRWLIEHVNYLLVHDFNLLIQLLYRVDVDEEKLKKLLQEQPHTDAAVLITDLLIQRQKQKQSTVKPAQAQDIPDEDKW
ncbi:MAG TPA: hypothetical protein VNR87_08005 [Flavisolibacter sp.]|nr:hypothetical protein [Flavisolibacter sp.]